MSTKIKLRLYSKLIMNAQSYASILILIILTSMSQAYAGKVEISLSYNDPAPVFAPNSVDLTSQVVTQGSYAIETDWPIAPSLSYTYFFDEDLTLPIPDPVHITKTGRYYIKAKAYSHIGTLYTAAGSVWVTINQRICNNSYISPETSGVVQAFTWTEPVIDPVGAITGGSAQQTPTPVIGMLLNNITNAPATAIYTIQVFQNGVPFQFPLKIVVNPEGKVNQVENQSVCSGNLLPPFNFETNNVEGTTSYSWTNNLPTIGLDASGTGKISSFAAVNNSLKPLVATIEVTPTYSNNGIDCTSSLNIMSFTITVYPIPILNSNLSPSAICSGTKFEYIPTCAVSGATFSWSRAAIPGISQVGTTGTANVNEVLTNTTTEPIIVTYTYSIFANGCTNTQEVKIPVLGNLAARVSGGTSPICYNSSPGELTATGSGGSGSYTYLWYKDGISTGVATPGYSPGIIDSTSTFYCTVTNESCGTVNTIPKTITVLADLTASINGGTSPICYNSSPGTLIATGDGGSGSYTYLWYKDGITTDITTQSFSPGNLISPATIYCEITSGSCGTVSTPKKAIDITPSVNILSFSPASSSRRQGEGSVTLTTSASNNSSAIVYSLDPITVAFAGNSIDAATGTVAFAASWSGLTTITASAEGCNGPATTQHQITTYIPSISLIKKSTFIDHSPIGVVNPGDQISYRFSVSNTGSVVLTNIIVIDPLVIITGGPISTLSPGAVDSTTFTASYTITQENINTGSVTNQAIAKGTLPDGSDVTDLSDDDSNQQDDNTLTVLTQHPAWSISKEAMETSYSEVGELLHYKITVTNEGNVYIENPEVLDPGADEGSILFVSGDLNNNFMLDPNEAWIYSAIHTVTQLDMAVGHYINTAQVNGSFSEGTISPATGSKDVFAKQTLTVNDSSTTEGNDAVFLVALNNPGLLETTFIPALSGNTTTIGVDTKQEIEYSNADGSSWTKCNNCTITIPPGVSVVQLRVPTVDDTLEEQTETFILSVSITSFNTVNTSATGIGTILDNDDYPTAVDDLLFVDEDNELSADCSVNDFPNSPNNKWEMVQQPNHGQVQMNTDGTFTYTPAPDYSGSDSFTYKLCDLEEDCDEATVSIAVQPTNDSPDANDDEFTMNLDFTLNESVTENDIPSPDGGNIWSVDTPPNGGTVMINSDGSFIYTANSDFTGSDSFIYKLCDQDGSCDLSTVTISVEDIVPNQILTPNNDGINDTFYIENIEFYQGNHIIIYNRWGNIVYQKSGYLNDWDGYSNMGKIGSKPVPIGTYYYVIDYGNNRHKVGYVYLQKSN